MVYFIDSVFWQNYFFVSLSITDVMMHHKTIRNWLERFESAIHLRWIDFHFKEQRVLSLVTIVPTSEIKGQYLNHKKSLN